jgi:putative heme-binding domain-containing protein
MDDRSETLVGSAVSAARRLMAGAAPRNGRQDAASAALSEKLLRVAGRADLPAMARVEAIVAVTGEIPASPETFAFLVSQLAPEQPNALRLLATEAISRARLEPAQLDALMPSVQAAGPMEINTLLLAYRASKDEAVGLKLLATLKSAKALKSLQVDAIKPRLEQFGPRVLKEAEDLFASLAPDRAEQKMHLDQIQAALPKGDVRRGQLIFNSPKVACATCHAIGYLGGNIGPDLTRIGQIRVERDLLESILYPSASFVQSYEPYTVITKRNQHYDGLLRRNDAEEVLVVAGPDQETHIPRANVKEIRPGTVSIMPSGLDQQLSPQELADLVAFLRSCR